MAKHKYTTNYGLDTRNKRMRTYNVPIVKLFNLNQIFVLKTPLLKCHTASQIMSKEAKS